jgi:hypothetical protein
MKVDSQDLPKKKKKIGVWEATPQTLSF